MRKGSQPRVSLRKAATGLGIVVLAAVPAQPAQARASSALDCGSVLTHDVRLTSDLTCSGDALVVDGAATITVDLNGHTITSDGTALTVRNSSLVTVRGGKSSSLRAESAVRLADLLLGKLEFQAPVDARRVSVTNDTIGRRHDGQTSFRSSTLNAVTLYGVLGTVFSGNTIGALAMADATGTVVRANALGSVVVHQSDEVTLENNRARWISVGQSRGFHAVGNQVTGNGTTNGISLSTVIEPGVQRTVISGNTVRYAATGISIRGAAGDVTVSGNTVEGSSNAGLAAQDLLTGALVVTQNTFKRNGFGSTSVDPDGRTINDGVHISLREDRPSSTARLADNIARDNAGFGFEVVGPPAQIEDGGGNVATRNGEGACWGLECR
jgi:hypothetical protein